MHVGLPRRVCTVRRTGHGSANMLHGGGTQGVDHPEELAKDGIDVGVVRVVLF